MERKHVKSMYSCFILAQQDFGYWKETDWWRYFHLKAKSLPFYDQNHILSVKSTKLQQIEEHMIKFWWKAKLTCSGLSWDTLNWLTNGKKMCDFSILGL